MGMSLPSSWLSIDGSESQYHEVKLPISRHTWLAFADVPHFYDHITLYNDLKNAYPEGFVIRGCPPEISELFHELRHDTCRTGVDAVIDLSDRSHFDGKKVLAALKRGWRHGTVEDIPLDKDHANRFQHILSESPHAGKPPLKHLFRNDPLKASRCFVFRSFSGNWLACLTLTRQTKRAYRTELMIRSRHAPGDIMECLIAGAAEILRSEGAGELSLGEVPFILHEDEGRPLSIVERLLFSAAPLFRHAYDYHGLYHFKNKFRPVWRTMRLCAGPGVWLSPSLLAELAHAMGFIDLLTDQTLFRWLEPSV